ncbi:MAG TPA: glycerol-3-phosphate dehydrogenase/oxidase [Candidatus Limnocylindria bacterium]|nr:glycerol-3-phosphate dehydrogenase/oxidase [Candidatus Limnocylindria bacterium]
MRSLGDRTVDLLVIGGGIIGAGIARDAALRGLEVALVEQADFGSGTTSRPTRLIHGGLRYLELFDFALVRSDMREREILLRIASHLVFPLPFLLPLYRPSFLYQLKLRLGMQLYDLLSLDKSLPRRQHLNRAATLAADPSLEADGLAGAWRFYDAQVPLVERLVIENLVDAAARGAFILNHAQVVDFLRTDDRVIGVRVRDGMAGEDIEVRARYTVVATGPWLDRTIAPLRKRSDPLLRLTKGVHIVTRRAVEQAHVLFAKSDGRLFFAVPWLGATIVGTTDTDYSGDPGSVAASEADVRYLQDEARRAFPSAPFDEIYFTWAGVRALVREEGVSEGEVSRKHALFDHAQREGVEGVLSVVGGKITAYRAIAEEVVDAASRRLSRYSPSRSADEPLPGARPTDHAARPGDVTLDAATRAHLGSIYGARAREVLDLSRADPSLAAPLCPHHHGMEAEIVHAVQSEWGVTLGDVLLRRNALGLASCQALDCVDRVADRMAVVLGWDHDRRRKEIEAYRREIEPMRRFSTE